MRMSQHNDMENIKDKITGNDGDDNWAQLKRMDNQDDEDTDGETMDRKTKIRGDILTASRPSHASGPF